MRRLAALEDEAPDLEEVLEVDEREARPDAVGALRVAVRLLAVGGFLLLALLVGRQLVPAGLFALGGHYS